MNLKTLTEDELVRWIEDSITNNTNIHGHGYQGHVYLYQKDGECLIIKVASGRGILKWLRRHMLRNEYRVYKKLKGYRGSPHCYGFLKERYLILEYIDGIAIRHAEISDHRAYYNQMLEFIKELHRRGVAHGDLKRKDNLMVVDQRRPCLIDFGTAVLRKPGFAPINHFLYELARKFDLNAWIKLKYQGRYEDISPADRAYFNRTRIEKSARWIKKAYTYAKQQIFR